MHARPRVGHRCSPPRRHGHPWLDVTRNRDDVHVSIGGTSPRTVTCLARFEAMLWGAAQQAWENLLVAPAQPTLSENRYQESLNQLSGLLPTCEWIKSVPSALNSRSRVAIGR
jgi:hypothetical protein